MFKLPNQPSPQAEHNEMADFIELISWDHGSASKREVVSYLGQIDDNDRIDGCDNDDDENSDMLDEVMLEIERRAVACGVGYPFKLDLEGTVLRYEGSDQSPRSLLYRYLLLSTRLNMKDNRVHAGIDGALLLEEICAQILRNYLGKNRAKSLIFGTAAPGPFGDKVVALCRHLREGKGFRSLDDAPVVEKDSRLDVVAWIPYSDGMSGQLIVFCQCKTGTTWDDQVDKLNPSAFIQKWIDGTIVVTPVRVFCISEAASRARWNSTSVDAGIILDRCRLVDFCEDFDANLLAKIATWTAAAKQTVVYA